MAGLRVKSHWDLNPWGKFTPALRLSWKSVHSWARLKAGLARRTKPPSAEGSEGGAEVHLAPWPSRNKTHELLGEGLPCSLPRHRWKPIAPGARIKRKHPVPLWGPDCLSSQNTTGRTGSLRKLHLQNPGIQCQQKQGWVSIALCSVKEFRLKSLKKTHRGRKQTSVCKRLGLGEED